MMPGRRKTVPDRDADTGTTPTPAGEIPDSISPSGVRFPPGHCVNSAPFHDFSERTIQRELYDSIVWKRGNTRYIIDSQRLGWQHWRQH